MLKKNYFLFSILLILTMQTFLIESNCLANIFSIFFKAKKIHPYEKEKTPSCIRSIFSLTDKITQFNQILTQKNNAEELKHTQDLINLGKTIIEESKNTPRRLPNQENQILKITRIIESLENTLAKN